MVLAIVKKELRETRLFAVLALGLYFMYLSNLTGHWGRTLSSIFAWVPAMNAEPPDVPFVQGPFVTILFFIGAALAITLGFRQSAWEPSQGTAQYLLHLPLSRRTIFLTKLTTGISLLLWCTLLRSWIYAIWAAMKPAGATHAGPVRRWSMTWPAVSPVWLVMRFAVSRGVCQRHPPGDGYGPTRSCPRSRRRWPASILAVVSHMVASRSHSAPVARGGRARQRYPLGS